MIAGAGKVYENNNYQDDWDGHTVDAGVYYYTIDVEGETSCKGWVQVIK
ncbi:MAG: gliding motility-associated C-terminal domain-containing protein [Flammeovirgaceae bacterium]|nr:gliding motility-associated C-terminal domain-containing protein [Flammeovirgaceae bacterium]